MEFLLNISWQHWLVILSALISIGGSSVYIYDTLKGKTKPNRVTWSIWAIAPLVAVGAAISEGADPWTTVRVFLGGFMPLLILLASLFNKKSYWKISTFDKICGVSAIGSLLLWIILSANQIAIFFAILADGLASLPTFVKAWKAPKTETAFNYIANVFSLLIILPAITVWNFENAAFNIFLLLQNILFVIFIYRKKIFKKSLA